MLTRIPSFAVASVLVLLNCSILAHKSDEKPAEKCYSGTDARYARVIRGLFKDTPFAQLLRRESYLRDKLGNATVRVEFYKQRAADAGVHMAFREREQRKISFGDFLDKLALPQTQERVYIADCDVGGRAPLWLSDGGCISARDAAALGDLPSVLPHIAGLPEVSNQPVEASTLFIGNGSTTQYHNDGRYAALIVQVVGVKQFVLVPSHATEEVGQFKGPSPFCRFADSNSSHPPLGPAQGALSPPSSAQYYLSPGDAIFVPPYWWHAVYGNELPPGPPGITLTFFFLPHPNLVPYAKPHRLQKGC